MPLHKWLQAISLVASTPHGLSALKLSQEVGITPKSARSILNRLREDCGIDPYDHSPRDPYATWQALLQARHAETGGEGQPKADSGLTPSDLDVIIDDILAHRAKARSEPAWRRRPK